MGRDEKERFLMGKPETMKKPRFELFVILSVCSVFMFAYQVELFANELSPKEKALQALKGQDYTTVINICLDLLGSEPDDYELNFILARAYAYSGQRDKALGLTEKMLGTYPENLDLFLFRSRVQSWAGCYDEAESGYKIVLVMDPENIEAMTGLAEIASWKRNYGDAIQKYRDILQLEPDNPDIYFRIGRVHQWDGNYQKAKENYQEAIQLDPENENFRQALKNAHPVFKENYELRYQYTNEAFSDGRDNYIDHHLYLSMKISPDIGSLHLKYNQTHRFDERDVQYGFEFYPHLWKKAYGYLDFTYSSKAIHYPQTSFLMEVYQSLFQSAEFSLGYRRMNFKDEAASVYLGSVGYYVGNYYPSLRWYYSSEETGPNFSWIVNVRRYFSSDSYLAIGYGQGSRPFEIITREDVLVKKSWIFLAEWDWYFLRSIRLKVQFMHRSEEDGPTRNLVFVATGYRW
ncbi:MAG: YaiO family outer membrane beta-barrel protein [Candidatus Aminicenantes bacterium]|nr:YaiO family outer membrane beta-barrel protein [Candidatus Aminicenantes bacterium]